MTHRTDASAFIAETRGEHPAERSGHRPIAFKRIGCPMLVTISAPTSLALSRARAAGLDRRVLARPDSVLSPALAA